MSYFRTIGRSTLVATLMLTAQSACMGADPAPPVAGADRATPDAGSGTACVGPSCDAGPEVVEPLPEGCASPDDPGKAPSRCVVDGFGVFVSASASAEGNGTRASPFKTLARALAGSPRRLFVCAGRYEGVAIAGSVSVHGGFSCSDWSHGPTNRVEISATREAPALTLKGAKTPVFVSDVHLVGQSAPGKGKSSVAAFVASSGKVTFTRVKLEARAGGEAEEGKMGHFTYSPASSLDGKNADEGGTPYPMISDDTEGAGGDSGNCPGGGRSIGGAGGALGLLGQNGAPPGSGGAGGIGPCTSFPPTGGLGAYGSPGRSGEPGAGATVVGTLTEEGWVGKAGTRGQHGSPGGGGGGGYGTAGAGGGGGAGGCGGEGGGGGSAGGSSIALLILDAEVVLVASELMAAEARPGGLGGTGQKGQEGLYGPVGGNRGRGSGRACDGGSGGMGGGGGPGGGGAGGVSAGIVWSGSREPLHGSDTRIARSREPSAPGGLGATNGVQGMNADVLRLP